MSAAVLAAASCTYDPYDTDIDPTVETMTLKCENPMVEIDENNLNAPALTFTWSGARHLPEEYVLTYKAELDVLGNSFGSKTVITSGVGFDYTYDNATAYTRPHSPTSSSTTGTRTAGHSPPTRISHWNSV